MACTNWINRDAICPIFRSCMLFHTLGLHSGENNMIANKTKIVSRTQWKAPISDMQKIGPFHRVVRRCRHFVGFKLAFSDIKCVVKKICENAKMLLGAVMNLIPSIIYLLPLCLFTDYFYSLYLLLFYCILFCYNFCVTVESKIYLIFLSWCKFCYTVCLYVYNMFNRNKDYFLSKLYDWHNYRESLDVTGNVTPEGDSLCRGGYYLLTQFPFVVYSLWLWGTVVKLLPD